MRTFAGGWDWVINRACSARCAFSVQSTATVRVQGQGLPTYTELGVNTFQYTTKPGQNFMRNGTAGWGANGLTGHVRRADAVDLAGLRPDQGRRTTCRSAAAGRGRSSNGDGTFQSNGQFTFSGIFTSAQQPGRWRA